MLQRVAALRRRVDHELQALDHTRLSGELREHGRTQRDVERRLGRLDGFAQEIFAGHTHAEWTSVTRHGKSADKILQSRAHAARIAE